MASSISCSEISLEPASTIKIASSVPATARFRRLTSNCAGVGLTINCPSMSPTRTPAIGPSKGISDTHKAAEAPIMAGISGALSGSTETAVATICTSLWYPSGNMGRMGRSIKRLVKIAWVLGRPSLLIKPPGSFPTAYIFSSKSTVSGKKSTPSRGVFVPVAATTTTVSPYRTNTPPLACLQTSPNSRVNGLPPRSIV